MSTQEPTVRGKRTERVGRRGFLASAAGAIGGLVVLRSGLLGADAPSKKLHIAMIGAGGRARAHMGTAANENIVALCDVNEQTLEKTGKRFPKAQKHIDWRKCLEQKGLDAVICCTTDHTHAFVANWALNRDLHVYCEKPLGNTVEECRVVRANYLKKKDKLATQVGTQRHQIENFNRVRELVVDGAIGELKSAYAWGNRQLRRKGYLPKQGEPPKHLHYDLWLGPSPFHPYNPGYFRGCLSWNMYWDFGSGQVGDMGSHTMDLAWNALDADLPTTAEGEGEKFNPEVTPVELHTSWDIPKNDWRPAVRLHWYQGGMMPRTPRGYVDLKKIGHGAMFKGANGFIIADFSSRIVIPFGSRDDMTYFKPRTKDKVLPPLGHFQREWVDAAKGDLKTSCDFDYGGKLIETMLLGLVAYRVGKKIKYDGAKGVVTDNAAANALISKKYRDGWTLNG
ncbi:MAG: Gfo/Idh/MocA family oxidoreductase [Candidatus Brocadiae bacterium]|nr:Gfo/Idh/MocA family oxidoreductase [Candidatus Brocadiia bacterium]